MALRIFTRRGARRDTVEQSPRYVGLMGWWYDSTPPEGWLVCDGSTFSAATYPRLAEFLGGTTLPDMEGRVGFGQGPNADVATAGTSDGLAAADRTPAHTHAAGAGTHAHNAPHTHTAASHAHASNQHRHGVNNHSHTTNNHTHGLSGNSQAPDTSDTVTINAGGVGTRSMIHAHSVGSLSTVANDVGTLNTHVGTFTEFETPGNTGSAAAPTHPSPGTETTDGQTTAAADAGAFPHLVLVPIIKAA